MRVVFFADDGPHCEPIDDQINNWLSENDVKVIDIKFSSTTAAVADGGISAQYWHTSALVLYEEKPVVSDYPVSETSNSSGMGFLINCADCGQLATIKTKNSGQTVCYECKERSLK